MSKKHQYYLYLFFFIALVITFAHNGSISLFDQDEAAYAGFAKHMLETNNWLIPDFTWSDIHRKPPLHFWNIAISYKIFGINEFSVRFSSALFILGTFLLIYFWGRKLFGERVSFISAIVLSTSFLVPSLAKMAVTDATVLFFSTLSAFAVIQLLQKKNFIYVLVFWSAFALALLTKGPPIIIFSAIFIFILLLFHPNRKNVIQLHPWFFLPLALAPLFVWGYLTAQIDQGAFINWMIDWYILKRINGSVLGQSGPPGTHLLLIIAFFIPYLMFFPKAFWTGVSGVFKKDRENLILGAWFIAGWLIYEFSPSKLPAYCIVAHVPLAILIGKTIENHITSNTSPKKTLVILQFSLVLLISLTLLGASLYMNLSNPLKVSLLFFNILMIVGVVFTFKQFRSTPFIFYVLGLNIFFQLVIMVLILPQVDQYKNSTKRVAHFIEDNTKAESTIYIANDIGHPPSLPFYINLFSDKIITETDMDILIDKYLMNEPLVFVLSDQQKELFINAHSGVDVFEIPSFIDDRSEASYFIIMNDLSRQVSSP